MSEVRLLPAPGRRSRVAFVMIHGLDSDPVRVRFHTTGGPCAWRCEICGRTPVPACVHSERVLAALLDEGLEA
jgi:hypothetical protein